MADARRNSTCCRWRIGVLGLLTFVLSACDSGPIGGIATMPTVDPREAFGAFAHPAQPWDRLPEKLLDPELIDPDIRKVGSWPGAEVYILFSAPSTICLVIDSNPPWGNAGSSGCSNGGEYAATGTATLWSDDDPEPDSQATVLIPDSATATIERGSFIAAGNGVIGIKPTSPEDGVAVTITFPNGYKSHFDLKPPDGCGSDHLRPPGAGIAVAAAPVV